MEQDFYIYYNTRNAQIGELRLQGWTLQQIAELMGLSREYVKTLSHKQGVYGPQRKSTKVPVRKCPMCGQTAMF